MAACGRITLSTGAGATGNQNLGGVGATSVLTARVRVYSGNVGASVPINDHVGAQDADDIGGNRWCIRAVNVPALAASGPTTLTMAAWTVDTAGNRVGTPEVVVFQGTLNAGTGCETVCCGSGSGSGGMQVGTAPYGSVALSMAPLMWGLLVAGFEAGRGLLNGQWALDLKHVVGGYCVWDNGGDGEKTPLVELRCESPFAVTWKLTLKHGAVSEEYTRPATEWDPLTANVVRRAGTPPAAGVADQLTVIPG